MDPDRRGQVWLVDLGYVAKVRPCLVLSVPLTEADRALVTLVPHTTSPQGARFETPSQERFLKTGVFDAQSLVTIPQAKLIRRLGSLPPDRLLQVEASVRSWLGL
ncbi:type II toxin-antitoxin system PemK/MazF family toxin [Botrimarina sp.]|uniref:type II toxin-antitoxin system PemK/MazF family toxin n=1 Tax=Botrimarina sp. TaxID=2795802 RepID=UPI0032ED70ED